MRGNTSPYRAPGTAQRADPPAAGNRTVNPDVTGEIPPDARTTVLFRDGSNPAIGTAATGFMRIADEIESWLDNAVGGVASSLIDNLESAPGDVIGSYRIV